MAALESTSVHIWAHAGINIDEMYSASNSATWRQEKVFESCCVGKLMQYIWLSCIFGMYQGRVRGMSGPCQGHVRGVSGACQYNSCVALLNKVVCTVQLGQETHVWALFVFCVHACFFSIYVLPHLLPFGFLFVHGWLAPFCMALLQENCKASLQRKSSFEKMDQERLRVLSLQVLLQILQQVVLEISTTGLWNRRAAMEVVMGRMGRVEVVVVEVEAVVDWLQDLVSIQEVQLVQLVVFALEVELVQLVVAALAMLAIMLHHHLRPLNCWCQLNAGSVAGFATQDVPEAIRMATRTIHAGSTGTAGNDEIWKEKKGWKWADRDIGGWFWGKTKHFTSFYCIWEFAGWIDGMMHAMSNIRIFMLAHEVSRYSVFCVQNNRIYTAQKKVVYYYHPRLKKDAFRFKYNSQVQKQKGSPSVFTKKKGTGWP